MKVLKSIMQQLIKILPSQVKLDIQKTFFICEKEWGSIGLMALVVYGSSIQPPLKKVRVKKNFLFWTWDSFYIERNIPNDIDIAVIYKDHIKSRNGDYYIELREECILRERIYDGEYSHYWADSTRKADLHLMCIDYNTLIKNSSDGNLTNVLQDGIIVWGDLPRPMRHI